MFHPVLQNNRTVPCQSDMNEWKFKLPLPLTTSYNLQRVLALNKPEDWNPIPGLKQVGIPIPFFFIFESVIEQNTLLNAMKAPGGNAMSEGWDRWVTRMGDFGESAIITIL